MDDALLQYSYFSSIRSLILFLCLLEMQITKVSCSFLMMTLPFHSYLIASMGLQMLWSFGLACLDVYALRRKRDLQNPVVVSLFLVGDWVYFLAHIFYFIFESIRRDVRVLV